MSSPLRNGPAVSLWVEVSQLCLVMTWLWVILSLDYSREEVPAFCVSGPGEDPWIGAVLLTAEGVQLGLRGCGVPRLGACSLWLPNLSLGGSCCLSLDIQGKSV